MRHSGWNSLNDLLWKGESLNLNTLPHLDFVEPVKLLFRKEFATIQDKDWDDDLDEGIVSKINDLTLD
ncbi:hypothetical protein HUG17_2501 [Dermatophagoides farinae]|uniref:Uncharacterized protein n=1 Tax=Dermatophagoides farinae TaxID=6954 RepID=A0A9D4SE88_DERFA|nr:hypothetical protein HUG17_2501 [Dermatophagoides farinae]